VRGSHLENEVLSKALCEVVRSAVLSQVGERSRLLVVEVLNEMVVHRDGTHLNEKLKVEGWRLLV
jgi:hypothetical protein